VSRHPLRDLDPAAIRQVIGNARNAKAMAADGRFNFSVRRAPATMRQASPRSIGRSQSVLV
jgi:hypothetical protein